MLGLLVISFGCWCPVRFACCLFGWLVTCSDRGLAAHVADCLVGLLDSVASCVFALCESCVQVEVEISGLCTFLMLSDFCLWFIYKDGWSCTSIVQLYTVYVQY